MKDIVKAVGNSHKKVKREKQNKIVFQPNSFFHSSVCSMEDLIA